MGKSLFEVYRDHLVIPKDLARALAGETFIHDVAIGDAVVQTWLTPVRNAAGEVAGVIGVSTDVTVRRHLQSRAVQNDRVVAMGALAASVGH